MWAKRLQVDLSYLKDYKLHVSLARQFGGKLGGRTPRGSRRAHEARSVGASECLQTDQSSVQYVFDPCARAVHRGDCARHAARSAHEPGYNESAQLARATVILERM